MSELERRTVKDLTDNLQVGSLPLLQSQQSHLISSQASNPCEKVIPLFSNRKFPHLRASQYASVSSVKYHKDNPSRLISTHENLNINAKYTRIATDPNFQYKSITEVPEQYRSIFSHFPHFNKVQSKVFDDVLYSDNPIVLSSPTGSGKTVIFELAIVRALIQTPTQEMSKIKIVYMAPMKALCAERLSDWKKKFASFNIKCLEVTGDSDNDDYSAIKSTNLIFTTPEKWDSVTRKWKEHVSQMEHILLFLIDEVHMVGDSERGSTIEAVISRMKCIKDVTKSSLRFIAVSATIPNPEDFASWLSSSNMDSVCFKLDESYRPVPLQKIVLSFGDCTPPTAFKFDLNLNYKLHNIIQQYSSKCPTIVFCSTRKSAAQAASTLQSQKRFVFSENERQHIRDSVGNVVDCKLRELLVCGVGYHHAGLTPSDKGVVETLFTAGYLPVICATSTLAMGVNLPAHLVIVKSTLHYAGGKFKEYSPADIMQMIGRAGRPQFDTSAVAVIMTQNSTKNLYNNLVSGTQIIESNIHHNLTEHLNSEIVLKTLTHVKTATQWMTSLFLYVRITKNPTRYGLPPNVSPNQIKEFLQNAVMNGINSLRELNFISFSPDGTISPTESGSLMARFYISFNTMKTFSQLKGDESLNELIGIIAASYEFSDVQLRVQEKNSLNLLNKNKNGPIVRYPFKDRIKTKKMKTSILIQSVLGCLQISDFSLNQESIRIMKVAGRVSKCLLEFQSQNSSFECYVNCLLLMKCLNCKLWENTKFVARQFKNVGPMLGNLLANTGIVTLQKLVSTDPRELEMITNKNPPFGTNLVEQVSTLPQYDLFVQQTGDLERNKATLQVTIKPKHDKEPAFNSLTSLVIGTPENVLIYKRKFKDKNVFESQSFQCEVNVYRSIESQSVIFWLISHLFVGGDIKSKFTPKFIENVSFKEEKEQETSHPKVSVKNRPKAPTNPYKQHINPYANKKELHTLKMEQKLKDSSRIVIGKNTNREISDQKSLKLEDIVNPPDELSDFDDLPEIDWKIKEIIEPQTKNSPDVPILSVQSKTINRLQINGSVNMQAVKPILKSSSFNLEPNTSLSSVAMGAENKSRESIDVLVQEMEDSGYFDDFEKTRSFNVGVDELLGEDYNITKAPEYSKVPENHCSPYLLSKSNIVYKSSRPTCVSLPMVNLAQHESANRDSPEKHDLDLKVIRVDENGDQFRECGHKCADKTSCSHFCCRYGVKVKPSSKRAASASTDLPPVKKNKVNVIDGFFDSDSSLAASYRSKTDSFRITKTSSHTTASITHENPGNHGNKFTDGVKQNYSSWSKSSQASADKTKTALKPLQIVNSGFPGNSRITQGIPKPQAVSRAPSFVEYASPLVRVGDNNCVADNSINVCQIKQKYVKTLCNSKENPAVVQNFEATQPPKFQTNVGFYGSEVSSSKSSSFSSIFDGIL